MGAGLTMSVKLIQSAYGWRLLGYGVGLAGAGGLLSWLWLMWLVAHAEGVPPTEVGKADVVVALAGSPDRTVYAQTLVAQGLAPDSMSTLLDPFCLRAQGSRSACATAVRNTIDEAVALRRIFARERFTKVIVVTSRYHLARARGVFDIIFAGGDTTVHVVSPSGERISGPRMRREALSYLPSLFGAVMARMVPAFYEWLVRNQPVCPDPAVRPIE